MMSYIGGKHQQPTDIDTWIVVLNVKSLDFDVDGFHVLYNWIQASRHFAHII